MEGFKVIPGFEDWCVTRDGRIYSVKDGKRIKSYKYGDRLFSSYSVKETKKLLSVHLAVALAWVENDDPHLKTIINHKDGNPMNNWYENLEWTTYSGNNYHAVNTGLRPENIPCKIRSFYTKEVIEFQSVAQAAEFMGLPKCRVLESLRPRRFGSLIAGEYEFRVIGDPEPFFYEDKPYIISPSRYMVTVEESDGSKRYLFKMGQLLQGYQLYRCPNGKSIPALVEYANQLYPDKKFTLRDGMTEPRFESPRRRLGSLIRIKPVIAKKDNETLEFKSLTEAARHFHVDRDVIKLRLSNPESTFLGWSFEGKPCFRET